MIFNAKKTPQLEETMKVYGYKAIKKIVMKCEANENKDECKRLFKEMGLRVIDDEN